jgi:hypothetical protein
MFLSLRSLYEAEEVAVPAPVGWVKRVAAVSVWVAARVAPVTNWTRR